MPTTTRKKLILNAVLVTTGCGSCRRPKLIISHFFNSSATKSGFDRKNSHYNNYSNNTWEEETESGEETMKDLKAKEGVKGFGRVGGESVAVEKDSNDPYLDFKHSMLQMILEKEIYSKEELRDLLNCFLQLNSPYYHGVIIRAFTEIWNGVFSVKQSGNTPIKH